MEGLVEQNRIECAAQLINVQELASASIDR